MTSIEGGAVPQGTAQPSDVPHQRVTSAPVTGDGADDSAQPHRPDVPDRSDRREGVDRRNGDRRGSGERRDRRADRADDDGSECADSSDGESRKQWDPAKPRPTRREGDLTRVEIAWRGRYSALLVVGDAVAAWTAGAYSTWPWGALVTPLAVIAALYATSAYEPIIAGQGTEEARRMGRSMLILLAVWGLVGVAWPTEAIQSMVLKGLPLALLGIALVHFGARIILGQLRKRGRCVHRVVAVGLERSVAEFIRAVSREPHRGYLVVGACVSKSREETIEGVPVVSSPERVPWGVVKSKADTVVLTAWSDVSSDDLRRLGWELEGSNVTLLVAPRLMGVSPPRVQVRNVGGVPLLSVAPGEFTGMRRVAREGLDYLMALAILLAAAPVMVVVGLAVRLSSPGPVFFRQERVGRFGHPFMMHKFRSMYVDAEARRQQLLDGNEGAGPLFKMKDDPRITPVGAFIRRYSLDELPQLLDVISGRMSLIGPRPPLPSEVELYPRDVRRRLRVKPGLTGLWQVSGRSDLSWDDTVRLDLYYVENWSLLLDLQILARTFSAVLAKKGAY